MEKGAEKREFPRPWRIIDKEPRKGEVFLGVYYTNKGYQIQYCYRDIDGNYHDIVAELDAKVFLGQMLSLPEDKIPDWVRQFKEDNQKINPPDYWWELPDSNKLQKLEIYEGCPTYEFLKEETKQLRSYEDLRKIEDEMNGVLE